MTYERFQALTGATANIVELLSSPPAASIEFKPGRVGKVFRPATFR